MFFEAEAHHALHAWPQEPERTLKKKKQGTRKEKCAKHEVKLVILIIHSYINIV